MLKLDSSLLTIDLEKIVLDKKEKLTEIFKNIDSRTTDKGDWLGWVKLHEDKALGKGDCVIKSRFGIVDGRIETKLKKVEEELRGS